eukprot:589826-Rhodomonas_salina.1
MKTCPPGQELSVSARFFFFPDRVERWINRTCEACPAGTVKTEWGTSHVCRLETPAVSCPTA